MQSLARTIIIFGVVLILGGGLLFLVARSGLPLGRLPGDFRIQTENFTCFFPLATTILLSILLTVILNIVARFFNR